VTGSRVRAVTLALCLLAPVVARADDAPVDDGSAERAERATLYARVIVESTPLRSGPGASYRQVGSARRGEVYPVRRRGTQGYWFQVERPDGTLAWLMGDAVYNAEDPGEPRFGHRIMAPPPLPDAHVEIAASFGALGGGGFMAIRPTILIRPEAGVELTGGIEVGSGGQLVVGGIGGIINFFPRFPITPFVVLGGGLAWSNPNADTFLQQSGTVSMLYGGGGLRFAFKYRLTLRFDVRSYVFFEADRYVSSEEYTGGLTVFF